MAAKFFTGLPLDGPDPECVKGHGERALLTIDSAAPRSRRSTTRTAASRSTVTLIPTTPPVSACNENPLAGFAPR